MCLDALNLVGRVRGQGMNLCPMGVKTSCRAQSVGTSKLKIEDVFPAFKVYTSYFTEMGRQDKYIIEFTGEKCKVPSHKIRGLRCLKFTEAMIWDLIG